MKTLQESYSQVESEPIVWNRRRCTQVAVQEAIAMLLAYGETPVAVIVDNRRLCEKIRHIRRRFLPTECVEIDQRHTTIIGDIYVFRMKVAMAWHQLHIWRQQC